MNCKIPFTKDIDFECKVHEITSISLEHEIIAKTPTLKGNFIIAGEFKSHEVSVNKEAFSYILPFEIDLNPDIDSNTIEFLIDDFTYEVIDSKILRVNIDFNVIAQLKEKEEEEVKEEQNEIFRDASELFAKDNSTLETSIEEILPKEETLEKENSKKEEENSSKEEPLKEEPKAEDSRNDLSLKVEETAKENTSISEDTIINTINGTKESYTTYHIHMVNDGESIETICTMYNSNINILSEYNDLSNIASGDKIIIPENQ